MVTIGATCNVISYAECFALHISSFWCVCGVCVFLWCVCVCVCVVCVCVCVCVCVVPSMAVFFSSLILCSPQDVAQVFYADFKIVPGAPVNYWHHFCSTFHTCCISVARSLYFRIFLTSFLIRYLSPECATSFNILFPSSLSQFMVSVFNLYRSFYRILLHNFISSVIFYSCKHFWDPKFVH